MLPVKGFMENVMSGFVRGGVAPADGNGSMEEDFGVLGGAGYSALDGAQKGAGIKTSATGPDTLEGETIGPESGGAAEMGANFERLEELRPELVNALRELVRQYREEGVVARRNEIRRIRQARLFWQGMQYAWWNPSDMNWHMPYEQKTSDDRTLEEMPRYQFVTNFYQGFGLSFVSVLSQDVPSVRFYPQSPQSLVDIAAARAASDVSELVERNNHVEELLTSIGYFLWTDGKLGAYVRFVKDGARFGFHEEELLAAVEVSLGPDVWVCGGCGKETEAGTVETAERGVPGAPTPSTPWPCWRTSIPSRWKWR